MKFIQMICLLVITLCAAGCSQERTPPEEADAWEVPADNKVIASSEADPEGVPNAEKLTETPEALPPGVVAIVKGSAFVIDGTTETRKSTGDKLSVPHYFAASAPVEFETSVTLMETDIEGQNADGSVPLVTMLLTSTAGAYRSFRQPAPQPIDGKQILEHNYDIGPGNYNVTITYFKDTVGLKRPLVTLNSVTFRNLPPPDDDGTPPADDGETPAANAGETPPANDEVIPPANDEEIPPANDGETPPANDEEIPPANAGETPPANDLSGQSN